MGVNKSIRRLFSGFLVLAFLVLLPASGSAETAVGGVIRIGGTGGALGGIREVADAYQVRHPGISIKVPPSLGSSGGIKALLAGALDIALISRPLTDDERRRGAVGAEYARTPVVFVTTHRNPPNLTMQYLASIYSGDTRTWPDGTPLRLILRPARDIDTKFLKTLSPAMEKALHDAMSREGMVTAITDQDNADIIERIGGGFGTSTLCQVLTEKRPFMMLRWNGVAPDLANLSDGSYPHQKIFIAVTGPRVNRQARSFIDFLKSDEGVAILKKTGHLPPSAP